MDYETGNRLDRIETKLDQLTNYLVEKLDQAEKKVKKKKLIQDDEEE